MTQMKLGASQIGGRLFKSAATSALALSALAGGVTLSGGEAKALNCFFGPTVAPGFSNCNLNQWYDTNPIASDKQIWFFNAPSNSFDDLFGPINRNEVEWKIVPISPSEWHVDVDFNPDYPTPQPQNGYPQTSIFNYAIKITDPLYDFRNVSLSTLVTDLTEDYTTVKDVFTATLDGNGAPVCGAQIAKLTNTNPVNADGPDPIGGKVICVTDTLTVNSLSVDAYQNVYRQTTQVPAPLPILGAAAAFGSVRKARKFSAHLKTFSMD
jgi:hypothetical protein